MIAGTVIEGRFRITRKVGAGGMGDIFHAIDRLDGATVAVKLLRGAAQAEITRFEREATVLAELRHPGIVRYIAHGTTRIGERYLVMEWLEGEDLERRFAQRRLSLSESLTIMLRTATALVAAHTRGVLHRDIKPSNIFLVNKDVERVKLLDFGIARLAHDSSRLTRTGILVGTPGYMAPEQVQGLSVHDPRTDIFSLGCVFFECLAHRPVFEGTHAMALLAKILLQDVPSLRKLRPDVPEPLERLVTRMLAKNPDERPADAAELVTEIERLGENLDVTRARSADYTDVSISRSVSSTPPSRDPNALTLREQRLISLVLAGAPASADAGATRELPAPESIPHGGRLSVLADGSMVVTIGATGTVIERAQRAARCALSLRERFSNIPLCVVTGRGVAAARMVEGEVIDRGVRALGATRPGTIRLDQTTFDMLGTGFSTEPEGDALALRDERQMLDDTPRLLGKPAPFLGRSRDLAMLQGVFSGCVEEPGAWAVLVTGAAGVGKSRLCREFLEGVRQRAEPAEILVGRADSLCEGSPFGIIADTIRRAAGILDGEPLEDRRRKLAARVGRHLAGGALTRVTVFLGELCRVPFPDDDDQALRSARDNAQLMGDSMRVAWEDWLAAECAARPVLLVLEDLHSVDAATIRLIDATVRNLFDQPLMVLALARPEVHTRFPALWAERQIQLIKLGPLLRKASEQFVRDALGKDADAALVARIVERADGNPFYLEELIRAVATGRSDAFPDSVLGSVEARLDAEGTEAKRVLRAASVFGERFSTRGVAALLGGGAHLDEADAWLEALAAREIITPARTSEHTADAVYVFRHALLREAAYATLTEDDRVLGHRLAGAWLEQAGHTDALTLAEHFSRGEETSRASHWYRCAAEQALKASDLPTVLACAERAVACGAEGEELGALRLCEAEAHAWRGELLLAEQRGVEATGLLAPNTAAWFHALYQAVIAAGKLGELDHTERWATQAIAATPEPRAVSARIVCLSECAAYLIFGGRYAAADALIAAIEPAEGLDAQAAAMREQTRALRASAAGDSGRCLERLNAALEAFEQAGDRRNACAARANIGFILAELGDFSGAEEVLRAALTAADRIGLHELSATALHNLGLVLAYRGNLDEARRLEQRAIDAFLQQGSLRLVGLARTYLAKIELLAGDVTAAEREALAAAEALRAAPSLRAAAVAILALTRIAQGRAADALEAAREAFTLLESLGSLEESESLVRLTYAEVLYATGDFERACTAITTARDRLLANAAKIGDSIYRKSFLENVPENARTLSLAREWLSAEPTIQQAPSRKC